MTNLQRGNICVEVFQVMQRDEKDVKAGEKGAKVVRAWKV